MTPLRCSKKTKAWGDVAVAYVRQLIGRYSLRPVRSIVAMASTKVLTVQDGRNSTSSRVHKITESAIHTSHGAGPVRLCCLPTGGLPRDSFAHPVLLTASSFLPLFSRRTAHFLVHELPLPTKLLLCRTVPAVILSLVPSISI
jgi:hypothetical protein